MSQGVTAESLRKISNKIKRDREQKYEDERSKRIAAEGAGAVILGPKLAEITISSLPKRLRQAANNGHTQIVAQDSVKTAGDRKAAEIVIAWCEERGLTANVRDLNEKYTRNELISSHYQLIISW